MNKIIWIFLLTVKGWKFFPILNILITNICLQNKKNNLKACFYQKCKTDFNNLIILLEKT